jgi:2-C-methyl-D-erythritol 4-phosphate cytidylyltransferase/2-C-methyl-D-erythritol 2,4-cyclodiphosphate synthase
MRPEPTIGVIIAAAGKGLRCGDGEAKQWRTLGGRTLVARAVSALGSEALTLSETPGRVVHIALVVDSDNTDRARHLAETVSVPITVVGGGATRTESVRAGISALPPDCDLIAVHDAARPFWPQSLWGALIAATISNGAAIFATRVTDTIKNTQDGGCRTIDRSSLWAAQTPQMFQADLLKAAHTAALDDGVHGTDDAELVERRGGQVVCVPAPATNIKITTPEDWALARLMTGETSSSAIPRVGIGYDAHRLGGECPLIIGGVRLAETGGLIGHSDGDVLLHAIADALLGAAALGDIGVHFPPNDPSLKGLDSRILLRQTHDLLIAEGYRPYQVDAVVMAEAPKLAPHTARMRELIATDLGLTVDFVSVKATTTEKMGFVGRGEGIAVQATATILPIGKGASHDCC